MGALGGILNILFLQPPRAINHICGSWLSLSVAHLADGAQDGGQGTVLHAISETQPILGAFFHLHHFFTVAFYSD